jgi:hypothetical protein
MNYFPFFILFNSQLPSKGGSVGERLDVKGKTEPA